MSEGVVRAADMITDYCIGDSAVQLVLHYCVGTIRKLLKGAGRGRGVP